MFSHLHGGFLHTLLQETVVPLKNWLLKFWVLVRLYRHSEWRLLSQRLIYLEKPASLEPWPLVSIDWLSASVQVVKVRRSSWAASGSVNAGAVCIFGMTFSSSQFHELTPTAAMRMVEGRKMIPHLSISRTVPPHVGSCSGVSAC